MNEVVEFLESGALTAPLTAILTAAVAYLFTSLQQRSSRKNDLINKRVESNRQTLAEALLAVTPFVDIEDEHVTAQYRIELCRASLSKLENLRGTMLLLGDEETSRSFEKLRVAVRESFEKLDTAKSYPQEAREKLQTAYNDFLKVSIKYVNTLG